MPSASSFGVDWLRDSLMGIENSIDEVITGINGGKGWRDGTGTSIKHASAALSFANL
jgi:hypothetical protein